MGNVVWCMFVYLILCIVVFPSSSFANLSLNDCASWNVHQSVIDFSEMGGNRVDCYHVEDHVSILASHLENEKIPISIFYHESHHSLQFGNRTIHLSFKDESSSIHINGSFSTSLIDFSNSFQEKIFIHQELINFNTASWKIFTNNLISRNITIFSDFTHLEVLGSSRNEEVIFFTSEDHFFNPPSLRVDTLSGSDVIRIITAAAEFRLYGTLLCGDGLFGFCGTIDCDGDAVLTGAVACVIPPNIDLTAAGSIDIQALTVLTTTSLSMVANNGLSVSGLSVITATLGTMNLEGYSEDSIGVSIPIGATLVSLAGGITITGVSNTNVGVNIGGILTPLLGSGSTITGNSTEDIGVIFGGEYVGSSLEIIGDGASGVLLDAGIFGSIDASSGSFSIIGKGSGDSDSFGVQFTNLLTVLIPTSVDINGDATGTGDSNTGILLDFGTVIITTLTADGSTSGSDDSRGVLVQNLGTLDTILSIDITGNANGSGNNIFGVEIDTLILGAALLSFDIEGSVTNSQLSGGVIINASIIAELVTLNIFGECNDCSSSTGVIMDGSFIVLGANFEGKTSGSNNNIGISFGSLSIDGTIGVVSVIGSTDCTGNDCTGVSYLGTKIIPTSSITIEGYANSTTSSGSNNVGVSLNPIAFIPLSVDITGTGPSNSLGSNNHGIVIQSNITTLTGVTIEGTSGMGQNSHGVNLINSGSITGVTSIDILGSTLSGTSNRGVSLRGTILSLGTVSVVGHSISESGIGIFAGPFDISSLLIPTFSGTCSNTNCLGIRLEETVTFNAPSLPLSGFISGDNDCTGVGIFGTVNQPLVSSMSIIATSEATGDGNTGVLLDSAVLDTTTLSIDSQVTGDNNLIGISMTDSSITTIGSLDMIGIVNANIFGDSNIGINLISGSLDIGLAITITGTAGTGSNSDGVLLTLDSITSPCLFGNDIVINGIIPNSNTNSISNRIIMSPGSIECSGLADLIFTGQPTNESPIAILFGNQFTHSNTKQGGNIIIENTVQANNGISLSGTYNVEILEGGNVLGNANFVLSNLGFLRILAEVQPFVVNNNLNIDTFEFDFAGFADILNVFTISSPTILEGDGIVRGTGDFENTINSLFLNSFSLNLQGISSDFINIGANIGNITPLSQFIVEDSLNLISFNNGLTIITTGIQQYSGNLLNAQNIVFQGSIITFTSTIQGFGTLQTNGQAIFPNGFTHTYSGDCILTATSLIDGALNQCNVDFNPGLGQILTGSGSCLNLYVGSSTFKPSNCFTVLGLYELDTFGTYEIELNSTTSCSGHTKLLSQSNIINSGTLAGTVSDPIIPSVEKRYRIVEHDGNINGEFLLMPDSSIVTIDGNDYVILYNDNQAITLHNNFPPIAIDDEYVFQQSFTEDAIVDFTEGLLSNDSDLNLDTLTLESINGIGAVVILSFEDNGSFVANLDLLGEYIFTYTVSDGYVSIIGSVNITVNPNIPTLSSTISLTPSLSISLSASSTPTPSISESPTSSLSVGASSSPTPSISITSTQTPTSSLTIGVSPSSTASSVPSSSFRNTNSATPSTERTMLAPEPPGISLSPTSTRTRGSGIIVSQSPISGPTISAAAEEDDNIIRDEDGNIVGTVDLPDGVDGDLNTDVTTGGGFPVVDITLTDAEGNLITQFDSDVEICFVVPDSVADDLNANDACLSFFNEDTGQFQCQDRCLTVNDNSVCGNTDHFTSFTILLQGGAGSDCNSGDELDLYFWLSLGFVAGALVILCLGIVLVEINVRKKSRVNRRGLIVVESKIEANL